MRAAHGLHRRSRRPLDFTGQVVVITGAARGIGEALARRVAQCGGRVALLDVNPERLAAVAAECGPRAAWWQVDVTDSAAMATAATEVAGHFKRIDAVVANAGLGGGGTLLLTDPAEYERIIEVNLLGSIRTVRSFLPHLLETRGYVLQIASLAALMPAPFMSSYCASKSGVEAFAHSLHAELRHTGVEVGVGYLSFTDTDMVREADSHEGLRQLRAGLPWPFNITSPLQPAVERLLVGLAHRKRHIYAQPWLRGLPPFRGALPGLTARFGTARAAAAEQLLKQEANLRP